MYGAGYTCDALTGDENADWPIVEASFRRCLYNSVLLRYSALAPGDGAVARKQRAQTAPARPASKKQRTRSVSVLLTEEEFDRFERFCTEQGHKKSTLIARLVREHLDSQHFGMQGNLGFSKPSAEDH